MVKGQGSVRAWMFTVAHNLVMDRFRARAVRPTEVAEHPAAEPVADDHADRVTDTVTVTTALGRLSDDHRRVLVELYLRGRSVRETAVVLGVPPGTVKSRTYYALHALRRMFDAAPAAQAVAA
jgi:RNA polymerase sigma-70 factor (ECF subfamily)